MRLDLISYLESFLCATFILLVFVICSLEISEAIKLMGTENLPLILSSMLPIHKNYL